MDLPAKKKLPKQDECVPTENIEITGDKKNPVLGSGDTHRCLGKKICDDKEHKFIKGTFDMRSGANSWDHPLRMISQKIKNIYKGDKELRDSEATTGIINRNKSYVTKSHEDYKKFVLENRSHLKDLLEKRRVERVSLAKESNQPNIEELTKPDSNILHKVANLSHDQIITHANRRSAIHKNQLGSLHITHNSMNAWDNHNKLPLKAIKKVKFSNSKFFYPI